MPPEVCRHCEYWDGGGEIPAKVAAIGDCLNPNSPRFVTPHDFTCNQFLVSTTADDNPAEVLRRIASTREVQERFGATGVDHESFDRAKAELERPVEMPGRTE